MSKKKKATAKVATLTKKLETLRWKVAKRIAWGTSVQGALSDSEVISAYPDDLAKYDAEAVKACEDFIATQRKLVRAKERLQKLQAKEAKETNDVTKVT